MIGRLYNDNDETVYDKNIVFSTKENWKIKVS